VTSQHTSSEVRPLQGGYSTGVIHKKGQHFSSSTFKILLVHNQNSKGDKLFNLMKIYLTPSHEKFQPISNLDYIQVIQKKSKKKSKLTPPALLS